MLSLSHAHGFPHSLSWILTTIPRRWCYYWSHFTEEEIEAKRGYITLHALDSPHLTLWIFQPLSAALLPVLDALAARATSLFPVLPMGSCTTLDPSGTSKCLLHCVGLKET